MKRALTATARACVRSLWRAGIHAHRATDVEDVARFIRRLRPRDLGHLLIRLGGDGDGGYLVPDDLDGIGHCFSPGVSDVAGFEAELLQRGISSFLADASVAAPPAGLGACDFERKFVGARADDRTITLAQWVADKLSADDGCDLILQMDIEGAEFETLIAVPDDVLRRFRIIVVELHNLHHLPNAGQFRFMDLAMAKVCAQFSVAHVHPNNCSGLIRYAGLDIPSVVEVTFLRNDRVCSTGAAGPLPHALDRPNLPDRPDLPLPEAWYQ